MGILTTTNRLVQGPVTSKKETVMQTLAEQIPEKFYSLFTAKYREVYIAYLVEIYNAIYERKEYGAQGITRQDCEDIVTFAAVVPGDIDIDADDFVGPFRNKRLNALLNWGWLKSTYNTTLGEDLIRTPNYSNLFIVVFKELRENVQRRTAAMRDVYSHLYTFCHSPHPDKETLDAALQSAKDVNAALIDAIDITEKQIAEMLAARKSNELMELHLQFLESEDDGPYKETSDRGRFNSFVLSITGEIREKQKEYYQVLADLDEKIQDRQDQAAKAKQEEILGNLYTIAALQEQINDATELYKEMINASANMTKRALERLKYISAGNTKENTSRLLEVVKFLAIEAEEGTHYLTDRACKKLSFVQKPANITTWRLHEDRDTRKEEAELYVIPDKGSQDQDVTDEYKPKYTLKDLKNFTARHTHNGCFSIGEKDLKSKEDMDMFLRILLRSSGDDDVANTMETGDLVMTEDGYAYTPVKWRVS